MFQKGFSPLIIVIFTAIAVLIGGGYFAYQKYVERPNQTACTTEVKQCPDGSYVPRTGPNCEFAPCPEMNNDNLQVLSEVSDIERNQILSIARSYVLTNSVVGTEFDLVPMWAYSNCIKFSVIPKNIETDNAQLFLVSRNKTWTPVAFGTAFPNLERDYPECEKEDISNWKTYRNEKYGFEVKYPSSFTLEEENIPSGDIIFNRVVANLRSFSFNVGDDSEDFSHIAYEFYLSFFIERSDILIYDQYVTYVKKNLEERSKTGLDKLLAFDTGSFINSKWVRVWARGERGYGLSYTLFPSSGHAPEFLYRIVFGPANFFDPENPEAVGQFDSIVKTFQFIK